MCGEKLDLEKEKYKGEEERVYKKRKRYGAERRRSLTMFSLFLGIAYVAMIFSSDFKTPCGNQVDSKPSLLCFIITCIHTSHFSFFLFFMSIYNLLLDTILIQLLISMNLRRNHRTSWIHYEQQVNIDMIKN